MKIKWIKFNPLAVNLPKERRWVLVQIEGDNKLGMPPSVAVGYLRRYSGRNTFFVVPGFGRDFQITHWCDCLSNDFFAPLWGGKQVNAKEKVEEKGN
ncbi:MAG: hypothetical protein HQ594_06165 [Candidatus Omnitrophica bacterium]|nr:hypothetical protein [Candidatus Omnitrophota bacterium]